MPSASWTADRMVRVGLLVAVIAALAVMAISQVGRPRTGSFDLRGTLRLLNSGAQEYLSLPAGPCAGAGPYLDIVDDAVVTVSANANALVQGRLANGTRVSATECRWTIDVPHVPAGKLRYTIDVGANSQRAFSEGDMRAGPVFTVGG